MGIRSRSIECVNNAPGIITEEEVCSRDNVVRIIEEGEWSACSWDPSCHDTPVQMKFNIECFNGQATRIGYEERCSDTDTGVFEESCVARGFVDHRAPLSSGSLTRATAWHIFEVRDYEYRNQTSDNNECPSCPQVNVTWFDAVAFCNSMSQNINVNPCYTYDGSTYTQTHAELMLEPSWDDGFDCRGYRLPTESEWLSVYNTEENLDVTPHADLVSVESLPAMRYGLHGMYDNAYEWGWDWFSPESIPNEVDYSGPETGIEKIIMGLMNNEHKFGMSPGSTLDTIGFRCVRTASRSINTNP